MPTVPPYTPPGAKSLTSWHARPAAIVGAVLLIGALVTAARPAAAENFKPFTMKTLEGQQTSLKDVLGKATLVVFFFPSCSFCNAAFPGIQKLHDTYKTQGLAVVWINVLPDQDHLIADWRARHGYTVPILLGGRSVDRDYKVTATPTHYLLDAKGKVLSKHAGYKHGDEARLERQIQDALRTAP